MTIIDELKQAYDGHKVRTGSPPPVITVAREVHELLCSECRRQFIEDDESTLDLGSLHPSYPVLLFMGTPVLLAGSLVADGLESECGGSMLRFDGLP